MTTVLKISAFLLFFSLTGKAQNVLQIPPSLTGTTFDLQVQSGSRSFYPATTTPTYGINGTWMAPTVIVNKGDSITLHVTNNLPVKTTMHWHGLHVAPQNDGGPHQSINPGNTWSPSFTIRNHASTYWYHPHGAGQTDPQVSRGLAGFFIVHDSTELALDIPHNYGVDDIPLVIQSKAFDELQQIAIATDMDTALFVNGTLKPYFNAPAQVVRFRLLNGSSLRSYNLGLSNGQTLYQIGTDGGLLDTPVARTRLLLSPGERAEILLDFSGMSTDTLYLKSFASELPSGIYGAGIVGGGMDTIHEYEENFLNGADFTLLQLNITTPTANPVASIPTSLAPLTPFDPALATHNRTIVFDTLRLLPAEAPNRAEGPFGMNDKSFDMDRIDEVVYLNSTETWTLKNNTLVAHPFHIHDIQFNIIEEHGVPVPARERGWKDVVLVMPMDSIRFLTRFETFTDPMIPYMYHCHLLHHEDDGMMGTFIVIDSTNSTGIQEGGYTQDKVMVYPNPVHHSFTVKNIFSNNAEMTITVRDMTGRQVYRAVTDRNEYTISVALWSKGVYAISTSTQTGTRVQKITVE